MVTVLITAVVLTVVYLALAVVALVYLGRQSAEPPPARQGDSDYPDGRHGERGGEGQWTSCLPLLRRPSEPAFPNR